MNWKIKKSYIKKKKQGKNYLEESKGKIERPD